MKYGIKYELKFTNTEKHLDTTPTFDLDPQEIDIGIYDRSYSIADDASVTVHSMTPSGDPLHITSVDNNEDKFTPIRAIQAKIQFGSDGAFNLATFTNSPPIGDDPGDPRWYVEIKIGTKFIFKGFLVLEDCSEAFMPTPNTVTLIAADGLAFIKNTALIDFADLNPVGYNRIADYLAMCLRQTGLSLNLNVVFNIRGAQKVVSGGTTAAEWVKIEYNSGASVHYFVRFVVDASYWDVDPQPTPPPFPTTLDMSNLIFVAPAPPEFVTYLIANYPGWINGIQDTGDSLSISGDVLVWEGLGHLFDDHFLNAKSWEDKIGTSISCWDVIERILGEEAYLTQRCGEWWILRVDEIEENLDYTIAKFLPSGLLDSITEHSSGYGMDIGKDGYKILFSDETTEVLQTSQHKFIKETYKLENPLEIICNVDMERGDIIAALPNETGEDGEQLFANSYEFECWKYLKKNNGGGFPDTDVAQDSEGYVKKLFDTNNREVERFLHMPTAATDNFYYWRLLDKIPLSKRDKFKIGASFRWGADLGGSKPYNVTTLWIRLYGDDGTYWNFGHNVPFTPAGYQWYQSNSTWTTDFVFMFFNVTTSTVLTDWNSIDEEVLPLPVSGELEILLINDSQPNSQSKDFTNLEFEYFPYINGSYQKYEQLSDKVSRTINFRTTREKQVYVSDGIRRLFKGALFTKEATINYTDNTDFQTDGTILVPDDRTDIFEPGFQFEVRNTGNNNRIFTVISSSWDSGINFTTIVVREPIVPEDDQMCEFYNINFVLANNFFDWKKHPTPVSGDIHPYLHIQSFDVWNQCRNVMQVFRAQCWGTQTYEVDENGEINYPSLIHTYYLQDPHDLTFNRRFILLSFDQDWYRCDWKGTIVETYNTDKGKLYTDTEEVKYE